MGNRKNADEANISRQNDATVINTSSFTSWKSSNPSVASVDSNGRITGNKAGTATISAKLKTGTKITISKKIKVVPTNQQIDPWE